MTFESTSAPALQPPSDDPAHPREVPGPSRPKRQRKRRSLPLLKRRRRLSRRPALRGVPRALRQTSADMLLAEIADGAHVEGHTVDALGRGWMVLTLTISQRTFLELCRHGAEIEDLEENGDVEQSIEDEGESSLGATEMVNQERWTDGHRDGGCDREFDTADDEPSLGSLGSLTGLQGRWSGGDRLDREQQCEDEGVDDDREPDADGEPSLGGTTASSGAGYGNGDGLDLEEGFGPSRDLVAAARERYRQKHPRLAELIIEGPDGALYRGGPIEEGKV